MFYLAVKRVAELRKQQMTSWCARLGTLDAARFSQYFDGAPVLRCPVAFRWTSPQQAAAADDALRPPTSGT